ncbi:hypothetical protein ACFE04_006239 [Oxalis oulophora]
MSYEVFTLTKVEDVISIYNVTDIMERKDGLPKRRVAYDVFYNGKEWDIRCSCLLFEFREIICRHIIKILVEKDVKEIPSRYILTRWRKDIKHRPYFVKNCYEDAENSKQVIQFNSLCANFSEAVHIANSEAKYDFLMKLINNAKERLNDDTYWGDSEMPSNIVHVEPYNTLDSSKKLLSLEKVIAKDNEDNKDKSSQLSPQRTIEEGGILTQRSLCVRSNLIAASCHRVY